MAGQDHRHVARQRIQPAFELGDLFKVEMVGRLVEQKHVGLAHPGAGKHGQPLPSAAQLLQRPLAHGLRHLERFQHHIDAPALAFGLIGRQRLLHGIIERRVEKPGRYILRDMADGQPARLGDLALARLQRAGDAGKQRRFAPPVGGDEADAIACVDDEIELGKQRIAQRHAEIADIDECHDRSLVLTGYHARSGAFSHHGIACIGPGN